MDGRRRIAVLAVLTAAVCLVAASPAAAPGAWRVAATYGEVFDVGGPLPGGSVVVQGGAGPAILDPATGSLNRFAPAFPGTHQFESYIAVVPAKGAASCFKPGDLYVIEQSPHGGVARVDAGGILRPLATVPDVDTLGGITFDATGDFAGRLLVTGPHQGFTTVAALGCDGSISTVTRKAPIVEGGITVAPAGFGSFGGDLVAPDELSGKVYAISPTGAVRLVAAPDLPHGGDIGVEGAGFVPAGDVAFDTALFADRATPGSPHPGNDYLLAASGGVLKSAGVRGGDLLLATEGGAALVAVRCPQSGEACSVLPVIAANSSSHGEGHLLVIREAASAKPPPSSINRAVGGAGPNLALVGVLLLLFVLALVMLLTVKRRRGVQTPR